MRLLNLGCGQQFHIDWINVDSTLKNKDVISYNLLSGIPFPDKEFDVVYHSHLLEHFTITDGIRFIQECYRVLKPGGIIRIVVPDLEEIVKNYLRNMEGALKGDSLAVYNYEWIMLEMYDQTVRNFSGGEMARFLNRNDIPNMEYVFSRIGNEGKKIHENYLNSVNKETDKQKGPKTITAKSIVKRLYKFSRQALMNTVFRILNTVLRSKSEALKIGRFRLSGEVHQWMYDRYSLGKLLKDCGFINIKRVTAFESNIKDWDKYELDSKNGIVRKPDSLFMEAVK